MQTDKRLKKMAITDSIADKLAGAKSIIVTDYRGLNTAQLLDLRQKLAEVAADFQITKNTLLKRALRTKGFEIKEEILNGPTAVLVAREDEVAPLKTLMQFIKLTQLPVVKAGYIGKDVLRADQVVSLAKLPSKYVLVAQVVGTMQAPISGMLNVLQANTRNLIYALNAIKEKQ